MIQDLVRWFEDHGFTWNLKGGRTVTPNEDDIQAALDEAARVLYDGEPGDQLSVGRLIIEKQTKTHDVYVYVGSYE